MEVYIFCLRRWRQTFPSVIWVIYNYSDRNITASLDGRYKYTAGGEGEDREATAHTER
jgi:hypothetical protein